MKSDFTTGIIIGIIIGVAGVKFLDPSVDPQVSTIPHVQTGTVVVPNYGYNDDGWDDHDYSSYGLHVR